MRQSAPRPGTARARRTALVLACCLLLAGCGQKGDLYIPERAPAEVSEPSNGDID